MHVEMLANQDARNLAKAVKIPIKSCHRSTLESPDEHDFEVEGLSQLKQSPATTTMNPTLSCHRQTSRDPSIQEIAREATIPSAQSPGSMTKSQVEAYHTPTS